jgi:hypothetical protein
MTVQNAIQWPEKYLPGTTDNFVVQRSHRSWLERR